MTAPDAADTRPLRRARYLGCALVAAGLAVLGAAGFAAFVVSLDSTERDPAGSADAIVALTGGAQRIGDAIELLSKGFGARLLITGVNERTSREVIARLSPGQRELVQCCVDLDYRAQNTVGNAVETGRWARRHGFSSLIVVTSNYHMPRTMTELDHALPDIRKVPYPVVTHSATWWASPGSVRLLAAEYAKYIVALLRTKVSASPPPEEPAGEPRLSNMSPAPDRVR